MSFYCFRASLVVCLALLAIGQNVTQAQVKPFKIRGEGTVDAFPGLGFQDFFTSGTATHFGRYDSVGEVGATSATMFAGDVTFTAANGDELAFEFSGTVTLSGSPPLFRSSKWDAIFTPTSGTGRFKRVVGGSFRMIAKTGAFHVTDQDIPFTWSGNGSLEFAKGKKNK